MRLLASTDFALRTLMRLAVEPDRRLSTEELATDLAISRNHLQKVVQNLADAGFVKTARGVGGGVMLARPAVEIGVGAVARAFESYQPIVECFRADGGLCPLSPACFLKGVLAAAGENFYRDLDRYSLADCLGRGRRQRWGRTTPERSRKAARV
ncbi:MAG TPA: Rrf2 family transcriptional regulator [Alphaproteobacteria bacterium]|nr:Rrf2 family transcriptional regulator [Alphaproteobacteria bacterium]